MVIDGLQIPGLLQTLIDRGKWPRTVADANRQNSNSLVSEDRNRSLRRIYLYPPPFSTVARIAAGGGREFYEGHGSLQELVPEQAIEIGDFGLGSDTPILLDYRENVDCPRVIHLEWPGNGGSNYYVIMAPDFGSFVEILGL